MFDTYRAAFRAPGTRAFCAAGFVMRMPIAIYPLGLVLLVSLRTHHYGFAGFLGGLYVVANGVGNPVLGRLVDRFGQSRILLPAAAAHIAGVVAICVLAALEAADWTLLVPTVVSGFCYLPVGSLVRARWSYLLADSPQLGVAYSLESTLDEVSSRSARSSSPWWLRSSTRFSACCWVPRWSPPARRCSGGCGPVSRRRTQSGDRGTARRSATAASCW